LRKKKPGKKSRKRKLQLRKACNIWTLLVSLSIFFFTEQACGQNPVYPFKSGEYAQYGAYFNWNFIWIQSGEVEFKADSIPYKNQVAWHLKAVGKTFKAYDLLYTVRDTFETFCKYDSFQPIDSRRAMNHGKDHSVHQYGFDYSSGIIATQIKEDKKPLIRTNIPVQKNTYDLLATAYNFRKFDFNKLFVGQKVPYRMIIGKQVDDLYFRYLGTEKVKTRTGKVYRCHKVSVYLLQGDFFPEGEYMKIWFTDDRNRLPVQVETDILVGSVKALLIETKSLKYPLTSQIK
jgi:hypothetical protein